MSKKKSLKLGIALLISQFIFVITANAAVTIPEKFIYEGRLLDNSGDPISTSHSFRFSLWSASAVDAGDVSGGNINTLAPHYAGWQEVQTVTPNTDGFFSFELGSVTPLPDIDYTQHLYLQVEVKQSSQPDTSYEILDRAPSDPSSDRSPLGSVPYAMNADTLDDADVGTSTGDIVLLGPSDAWPVSTIPGGTNADNFVLDSNDDAGGSISLQFGNTLSKILEWDIVNDYFNFNDDVNIQGNLTITGTVDGVDVSDLSDTVNTHLNGGPSKHDASEIDVEAVDGHYYSAGDLETVIDDLDEQIFKLSGNKKIILSSEYDAVSYKADGSNNIGRLYLDNDFSNERNFYVWKSTRPTLQDYDLIIQVPVPSDFSSWDGASPWTFNYRSTNAAATENKADIYIYDTTGAAVTLSGTSKDLASTSWASTSIGYTGSPTFTPGETFFIVIRMFSRNNEEMHIGEVVLNYK
jgi:hypothetical protein